MYPNELGMTLQNLNCLLHIWIFHQILDHRQFIIPQTWWLQPSTSLFYVVIYHFHLFMVCITLWWFDKQEHVMRMRFCKARSTTNTAITVATLYVYRISFVAALYRISFETISQNNPYNGLICDYSSEVLVPASHSGIRTRDVNINTTCT
jgi:hypothetical protein